MKYTQLLETFKEPIFSLHDLALMGQKNIPSQLSTLTKSGDLIRLKNGLYVINSRKDDIAVEHIAFRMYEPSYISLEWALYRHGLMPDIPFNVTSITVKATRIFENSFGSFTYKNLKKDLFFGYEKIEDRPGQAYLLAESEKAFLDYIYLNLSRIRNDDDIEGLRFNPFTMKKLDMKKLKEYATVFDNNRLNEIVSCLLSNK